ncbi:hypothetical protein Btru_054006 [Bulinus truncatus]|nr:hypothetical protein Btru_054006 [Bulinus truncatus]
MSSSEESEDDEMASRISAAVGDTSVFCSTIRHGAHTVSKESPSSLTKDESSSVSYRDDQNVEESGNVLSTTPGFRAHVSKQLSTLLDKKLQDLLSEKIWKCTKSPKDTSKGIQLFSNSSVYCCLDEDEKLAKKSSIPDSSITVKKRKVSSSSDSSEDEKIRACVFSQTDIEKENELLIKLQKSSKGSGPDRSEEQTSSAITTLSQQTEVSKKQKKTKKKKKKKLENIDV